MAEHPLNLAFRFLLELCILAAAGVWGWQQSDGWPRFIWAVVLPLVAAALWGVFRVPHDPGPALVAVPGLVRLVLELGLFAGAVWALADAGLPRWSWALGLAVAAHYLLSYDRILWLLQR